MELTNKLAKKIGDALKVDFNKIKLEDFIKGIKTEEEHADLVGKTKKSDFTIKDYVIFAKISRDHLNELPNYYEGLEKMEKNLKKEQIEKLQRIISKLIKENKDFKHKLKFEVNKEDSHYQDVYNKKLGKFKVDSPDQLKEKDKESFYREVDEELSGKKDKKNEMAFSTGRTGAADDDYMGYDPMTGQDSAGTGDVINNYNYKAQEDRVKAIDNENENAVDDRYNKTKRQYENKKLTIESISQKANIDKKIVKEVFNAVKSLQEANWIQGAINPSDKGDCSPMSKASCTPHKKALAKRFKSGDLHKENDEQELKKEVHPEGREKQVQALKKKFPEKSAYKIAWAQAEKAKSKSNPEGKPKKEESAKINPITENDNTEIYEFTLDEAEKLVRKMIDEFVRKSGSGWKVYSHEGKPLSKEYPSRAEAVKRLGQIEFFKHNK